MHAEILIKTLTHTDLAREVGVSVTTIKSYRRKFPGFIPVAGFGKPIRFTPDALNVCRTIRECFNSGLGVKETKKRLETAGFSKDKASIPPPALGQPLGRESADERMEEFLLAASTMMHSISQMAKTQEMADQRLSSLEQGLLKLAQAEVENKKLLSRFTQTAPEPNDNAVAPEPKNEPSATAKPKRIVNVRSSEGKVDSYALDESTTPEPSGFIHKDAPTPRLLDVPVAIRTNEGEYLGFPGRLTLRELAASLLDRGRKKGEMHADWCQDGTGWRYNLLYPNKTSKGLTFEAQTTPSGVSLAVITKLLVDQEEVSSETRLDYFRQIKDQHHRR